MDSTEWWKKEAIRHKIRADKAEAEVEQLKHPPETAAPKEQKTEVQSGNVYEKLSAVREAELILMNAARDVQILLRRVLAAAKEKKDG